MGSRSYIFPALFPVVAGCVVVAHLAAAGSAGAQSPESPALKLARQHYFSGRYTAAAEAAAPLTAGGAEALAAYELRTAALHFELKRLLGDASNKSKALKQCAACQPLIDAFMKDLTAGKALARTVLKEQPQNESALFYLGKLDLNYVWLQLSTLGKRTGWSEFWNARHSIEAVLKANPKNVRARVAYAWIEYIVDTKVPFGLGWTLGGGDKKKALKAITEAAATVGDPYEKAEAEFALWEMLKSDKRPADALVVAKRLIVDFPENKELQRFIATPK
jgi:tetratricopeptide (TPR) repeat protein